MEFITIHQWDEEIWKKASVIYFEAFGKSGAKPEKIIRNMFNKKLANLHIAFEGDDHIAMAISGKVKDKEVLIIDYIAVRRSKRNQGIGGRMLDYIKNWCHEHLIEAIIIEVESEPTEENLKRIQFWQDNGFQTTDYVHSYIWVPEPYRAMYVKLTPDVILPTEGEKLFQWIVQFHKESFKVG